MRNKGSVLDPGPRVEKPGRIGWVFIGERRSAWRILTLIPERCSFEFMGREMRDRRVSR